MRLAKGLGADGDGEGDGDGAEVGKETEDAAFGGVEDEPSERSLRKLSRSEANFVRALEKSASVMKLEDRPGLGFGSRRLLGGGDAEFPLMFLP